MIILITEIWFLKSKLDFDQTNIDAKAMNEAFEVEDAAVIRINFTAAADGTGVAANTNFHFDDHFESMAAVEDFPMTDRLYQEMEEPLFEDEPKVTKHF